MDELLMKWLAPLFLFEKSDDAGTGDPAPEPGGDEASAGDDKGGNDDPSSDKGGADDAAGDQGDPAKADASGDEGDKAKAKDDDGGQLGDGSDDDRKVVHADFPEDWKEKWIEKAGGDKKLANKIKRFKHPSDTLVSLLALEKKLSSGEYKRVLPKDATDEEKAAYRKEEGIPEEAKDYTLATVKDHEWNEVDESVIGALFPAFHQAEISQDKADILVSAYGELAKQMQENQVEADREFRIAGEENLRVEYGADYRANMGVFQKALKDQELIPGDLEAVLSTARTKDGQRLLNHPDFAKFVIGLGVEKYGEQSLLSGDAKSTASSRIKELEKLRDTDITKFHREGGAKELLELERKLSGTKRAA